MFIVNDFMADVDRCSVHCKCSFDDRNRTVNTGTKASWLGQQNFHIFTIKADQMFLHINRNADFSIRILS